MHFLCTQCLQPLQKMMLLPTPVQQTAHGNSPELCRRSSPVPQIIIFVFPAFTLSPFFSIASFHVKSLLTHSSSDSAMITRGFFFFLAHLSGRLRMSYCDHSPSIRPSVHLSVHPFTPLNDFSSETPGPNFFKLHVELCVKGELKICTNGHGP